MICPKCGAKTIDGSSFCTSCGNNFKITEPEPTTNMGSAQNTQVINNQSLYNQSMGANQQPIDPEPQSINNAFESGNANNQIFNSKPPKKINFGLIVGIVVALAIAIICGLMLFDNYANNDSSDENSNSVSNSDVDLTVDESISKSITCNLVGNALYGEKASYSYEYVLPNWNRYTFLKEYEPEYAGEAVYVVDYDKECEENGDDDDSTVLTNDFKLEINYDVDDYASAAWANIKEKATGTLLYTSAGSPTLYGDDNGYWFAYMDDGDYWNDKRLTVHIYKEVAKFEDAVTTLMGGNVVCDEYHALFITIYLWYKNETGKIRLNYILNDLKEILTEEYDFDLSELTLDLYEP